MDVKKIPKGSPLTFFGTMRLFKIFILCLMLYFLNKYPPIAFFNTIRILEVELRKSCAGTLYGRPLDSRTELFHGLLNRSSQPPGLLFLVIYVM